MVCLDLGFMEEKERMSSSFWLDWENDWKKNCWKIFVLFFSAD